MCSNQSQAQVSNTNQIIINLIAIINLTIKISKIPTYIKMDSHRVKLGYLTPSILPESDHPHPHYHH